MEGDPTITNLKDFIEFYSTVKSDSEIASLLDISVNEIKTTKEDLVDISQSNEKILNLL